MEELRAPLLVHEAVEQTWSTNAAESDWSGTYRRLERACASSVANVPVRSVARQQGRRLLSYCPAKRPGKSMVELRHSPKAAGLGQGFWAWLRKRELATDDPWSSVEPIGRVNSGKPQLGESSAQAGPVSISSGRGRRRGALALLIALYLGLRTRRVLGLTVGAIDGTTVFVAGRQKCATGNSRCTSRWQAARRHCAGRPATQRVFAAEAFRSSLSQLGTSGCAKLVSGWRSPGLSPSLRGLHSSLAMEAGTTTHQVASAWAMRQLRPPPATMPSGTPSKGKGQTGRGGSAWIEPRPTVEQILARLPKDERQVLLNDSGVTSPPASRWLLLFFAIPSPISDLRRSETFRSSDRVDYDLTFIVAVGWADRRDQKQRNIMAGKKAGSVFDISALFEQELKARNEDLRRQAAMSMLQKLRPSPRVTMAEFLDSLSSSARSGRQCCQKCRRSILRR